MEPKRGGRKKKKKEKKIYSRPCNVEPKEDHAYQRQKFFSRGLTRDLGGKGREEMRSRRRREHKGTGAMARMASLSNLEKPRADGISIILRIGDKKNCG